MNSLLHKLLLAMVFYYGDRNSKMPINYKDHGGVEDKSGGKINCLELRKKTLEEALVRIKKGK